MASVSSLCNWAIHRPFPNPNPNNSPSASISLTINRCKNQHVICCINSYQVEETKQQQQQQQPVCNFRLQQVCGRREVLFTMAFTGCTFPATVSNALAENDELRVYTDDANKFQISIPQDWLLGAGESTGFKSITAFYPEEASSSSVTVAITGLGPDFTRMESFGKVEAFAETLVGGLDRSWQRPPGVAAKLIDSKSANGIYYIEYTLQNPGESRKHLFSALGMASNGWYNRLYTVTGQFVDEESEKYGSKVQKAVSSFRFI